MEVEKALPETFAMAPVVPVKQRDMLEEWLQAACYPCHTGRKQEQSEL